MLKICRVCSNQFYIRDSHAHTRFTCGRACSSQEYKTSKLGENNPNFKPGREQQCQHCHCLFRPPRLLKKYCSVTCYNAARHLRKLERKALHQNSSPIQLLFPFSVYWKKRYQTPLRICPICQMPFKERRHRLYCPQCSYVMRPCVMCNTSFRVHRSSLYMTCSPACRRRFLSVRQQGERSHRWQGGKTSQAMLIRTSAVYDEWRKAVFVRDDYTCALCHERGGKLAAHHIYRFTDRPDLALEIGNGITLCWPCHGSIHWKEEAYIEQFLAHIEALLTRRTP